MSPPLPPHATTAGRRPGDPRTKHPYIGGREISLINDISLRYPPPPALEYLLPAHAKSLILGFAVTRERETQRSDNRRVYQGDRAAKFPPSVQKNCETAKGAAQTQFIATLFVKTTNDCNNPGQGGCYPGSQFLKDQIASDPGLAQEANWGDVTALVGTMADQIVAGIC